MVRIENVDNNSCSPNSIFLRENRFQDVYKIPKFPFGMLIFIQKSH